MADLRFLGKMGAVGLGAAIGGYAVTTAVMELFSHVRKFSDKEVAPPGPFYFGNDDEADEIDNADLEEDGEPDMDPADCEDESEDGFDNEVDDEHRTWGKDYAFFVYDIWGKKHPVHGADGSIRPEIAKVLKTIREGSGDAADPQPAG